MALHAMALFCEDIREESSGQQTVIGILPDVINLPPKPPQTKETARPRLPRLAVYFRVTLGIDDPAQPMNIKLIFSNGQEVLLGTIDPAMIERSRQEGKAAGLPYAGLRFTAVAQNFRIEEFGILSAVVEIGADKHTAGMVNLRFVDVKAPSASQPPS